MFQTKNSGYLTNMMELGLQCMFCISSFIIIHLSSRKGKVN